jgi:hypothetical protein
MTVVSGMGDMIDAQSSTAGETLAHLGPFGYRA